MSSTYHEQGGPSMLNADLTAYAGLFILGIIVVCTVLYYLNYKIDGSNSVGVVVLLSF